MSRRSPWLSRWRFRRWNWLAVGTSVLVCGTISWIHFAQRGVVTRTATLVDGFRRDRVELATGFLDVVLASGAAGKRAEGLARVDRALADLEHAAATGDADERIDPGEAAKLNEFAIAAADLRSRLDVMRGSREPTPAELAALGHAYQTFVERADAMDRSNQADLQNLLRRLDRGFYTALALSGVLLTAIFIGIYLAGRANVRSVGALQASEDRLQTVIDHLAEGVLIADREGRLLRANHAAARVHGFADRAELEALGPAFRETFEVTSPDGRVLSMEERPLSRVRSGEPVQDVEIRLRRVGGSDWRDLLCNGALVKDSLGRELMFLSVSDITERKRAEAELLHQERLLRETGRLARVGGWDFDPVTGEGRWTAEVARIHDLDPEVAPTRDLGLQFYHGEWRARLEEAVQAAVTHGTPYDLELQMVSAKGVRKWVRTICQPVVENGRVVCVRGAFQDISAQKTAELRTAVTHGTTDILAKGGALTEAVARTLELTGRLLDWDVAAWWTLDRAVQRLRALEVWSAAPDRWGRFIEATRDVTFAQGEHVLGEVWRRGEALWSTDVAAEPAFSRAAAASADGLRTALVVPVRLRNEVLGVIEFYSTAVRARDEHLVNTMVAVGSQIGQFIERQRLEEQFHQTQKLEAIGTLAGGIAHDFNNILAAILGYTGLARAQVADPVVTEHLDAVLKAGNRARDLVRQILAFSRMDDHERRSLNLADVLAEATRLLRATIPTTIAFESEVAEDVPLVLADATQVHQVIMNLAANAAHAVRHRSGRLTFRLDGVDVDANFAAMHAGLRAGRYARLSVRDNGHGMNAATLGRIFEPFFTTKQPGEGTGLGLAVVHGIMRNHDGAVAVYSHPGEGTRFDLYFPAHAGEAPAAAAEPEVQGGHGEPILLVEDEEPLARLAKRVLDQLGYVTATCPDAPSALDLLRTEPDRFALVITDLAMPGMSGVELAGRIRAIRADLPVILTTGYSASLTADNVRDHGIEELLLKPVTIASLGAAVHRVLRRTNPLAP